MAVPSPTHPDLIPVEDLLALPERSAAASEVSRSDGEPSPPAL